MGDDEYEAVLRTQELAPNEIESVRAHGATVVLINLGQIYYAFEGRCPNDGTNLGENGVLEGDLLVCPNDDWGFDVRTGERVRPVGGPKLERYRLQIEENEIRIGLPVSSSGASGAG